MSCLRLVIRSARRVRKAVIPAAGFGPKLFPASKAIKKELFPVIDRQGRAKPAIMTIVEEALNSGIEEVCLVVQGEDRRLFEEFFCTPPTIENFNKLSRADQEYSRYLLDLGHRITFVTQEVQDGFGHAVYCAREWVGNEPFLLLLGDHLYASDNATPCARQVLDVFERVGHSVVGLKVTPADEIHKFGCVTGIWDRYAEQLSITEFAEKPDLEYARQRLTTEGLDPDQFLTIFGIYVLTPKVFEFLEEAIRHNLRERGEFQLTPCLDQVRREEGFTGYVVKGRRFDIGTAEAYRQTIIEFRNA
ncbi:MAG: UTP--glucose-1-phosphate uridylyltransferase [candidate division KSB1 bacterium]|nr:UTP--glucose-1-phosphate uridylyltransferase [candidate division KSB1 bacterium]